MLTVGCVVIAAAVDCEFVLIFLWYKIERFQRRPKILNFVSSSKYKKKERTKMSKDNLTAVLYGIEDIRLVSQNWLKSVANMMFPCCLFNIFFRNFES